MRKTIALRLSRPQVKSNFNALPTEVREKLNITKETFKKESIEVETSNTGRQNPYPFVRFYCINFQSNLLPKLLNNSRYVNFKTIEELVTSWDDAKIPEDLADIVGCFICALDERVHMGPNKNSFFKDPTEHRKSYHPELHFEDVVKITKKHTERVETIQKLLVADSQTVPTLTITKPAVATKETSASSSNSATAEQAILTSKFNKKTKFRFVDQTFQKKISVNECNSSLQKISKGFCLSIVHNGVNKCLTEASIIEMYETAYRGIYDHHVVQEDSFKQLYGQKADQKTIMAPQQCCLDKNNIIKYEEAILKAYEQSPGSKHSIVRKAPFWGIMHDGIQKFAVEYNGMLLQTINPDSFELVLVPFRLMRMHGGVNAHDTIESLMNAFGELLNIKDNAHQKIHTFHGFHNVTGNEIPVYFKLGVIQQINADLSEIHLAMSNRLPIANNGDGVSVNVKAARVGAELYGLLCPDFRCSSHSVDGCWKRIARSETMCVVEVKTLYESLKPVVQHFKFSGKSKELLDKCMSALEMGHGVHLMTWCATRMAHFVVACQRFDDLLVPVYNAMFTMDLKKEERNKLFQGSNIFTMKLIADLHTIMHNRLQRTVDKDDHLVSETYRLAEETATNVRSMATPKSNKFMESLYLDGNGNLMFTESLNDTEHTLRLTDAHKPNRRQTETERLESIKEGMTKIKADVLKNIHDNLTDQIGEDTYYHAWSALDLADKNTSVEERVEKLDTLIQIFVSERVHEVQRYIDVKETQVAPFKWHDHGIFLHYPAILSCSSEDLAVEIKRAWASIGRLYQKCHQETHGKPNQREVWRKFLLSPDSGIMYPNMCTLVQILLATPSNTSPLERSYPSLEMICSPRRNHIDPDHLELTLFVEGFKPPGKDFSRVCGCCQTAFERLMLLLSADKIERH